MKITNKDFLYDRFMLVEVGKKNKFIVEIMETIQISLPDYELLKSLIKDMNNYYSEETDAEDRFLKNLEEQARDGQAIVGILTKYIK